MADTLTNPMHVEVISPDGAIYQDDGVDRKSVVWERV